MNKDKYKRSGKLLIKAIFALCILTALALPFLTGGMKDPRNPLSHKGSSPLDSMMNEVFTTQTTTEQTFTLDDLLSNIDNFVQTPEGGVDWRLFGETGQTEYSYKDEDGMDWSGVRPIFSDNLKNLDGQDIIIQGYMFPLAAEEQQPQFLLGPFPVSCPYHYHVTPNLIIEVNTKTPIAFSYDALNLKGKLELVPKDDEYNVFYRLNEAVLAN